MVRSSIKTHMDLSCEVFIDDASIKGLPSDYNGETIPGNPEIRRFIYEYATTLERILAWFIAAGITASGLKTTLASPTLTIIGSIISLQGWHLERCLVSKVEKWPLCTSVSKVWGFLGTIGCRRKWIKGFALIAKPLTLLMKHSDHDFEFTAEAMEAMDQLKHMATSTPILISIDYRKAKLINPLVPWTSDEGLVSIAVDATALYGAGWVVYQTHKGDKKPAIYGSCTYNDQENHYSQPKAELFGVFWAFKHLCHRIWGIHFCLEHDAKFLKEMITSPDLPNSPMTRWIAYLLLFNFNMKHIKAENHKAPDRLSQWPWSAEDSDDDDAKEFLNHFIGNSKWIMDVVSAQDVPSSGDLDRNQVKCLLSTLHFQSRALNQMNSTTRVSYAPIEESDSSEKGKFHAFILLVEESEPHFNTYIYPMRTTHLQLHRGSTASHRAWLSFYSISHVQHLCGFLYWLWIFWPSHTCGTHRQWLSSWRQNRFLAHHSLCINIQRTIVQRCIPSRDYSRQEWVYPWHLRRKSNWILMGRLSGWAWPWCHSWTDHVYWTQVQNKGWRWRGVLGRDKQLLTEGGPSWALSQGWQGEEEIPVQMQVVLHQWWLSLAQGQEGGSPSSCHSWY